MPYDSQDRIPPQSRPLPRDELERRFWARVDKTGECWEWQGQRKVTGYGRVYAHGRFIPAHRFAWELENGPIRDGLLVLHRCDNPPCVNVAHLFLGTQTDNNADRDVKGRRRDSNGEENGRAKLTIEQVRDIRAAIAAGLTQSELARRYGVGRTAIANIHYGKTWTK